MIYRKFNKFIHDYFFKEENLGDNVILTIDDYIINLFCQENNCRKDFLRTKVRDQFRKSNTTNYTSMIRGIPQYFGIIAIQIYIVSQMEEDPQNNYSYKEYNPRLAEYVEFNSNELETWFKDHQENIWMSLNDWATSRCYYINLPSRKKNKGRFIQYPLSQALLNNEDLKRAPIIFKKAGINFKEELCFDDFIDLIDNIDKNQTNHFKIVKSRLEKKNKTHLLFEQLFNYYSNKWDGYIPDIEQKEQRNKTNTLLKTNTHLYFFIDKKIKNACFFEEDGKIDIELPLNSKTLYAEIRQLYNIGNKEILLFEQDTFSKEWNYSRFLEVNKTYLILYPKNQYSDMYYNFSKIIADYSNYLYSIKIIQIKQNLQDNLFWKEFFSKRPKSFQIDNGLKLYRNSYMLGAGPTINFLKPQKAWINGEKISLSNDILTYSLKDAPAGTYTLKVKSYPPQEIIIKEPQHVIVDNSSGWIIDKQSCTWEPSNKDFNIIGLSSKFTKNIENGSVKNWRNTLLNKNNHKYENSSILIKALKRANYGV